MPRIDLPKPNSDRVCLTVYFAHDLNLMIPFTGIMLVEAKGTDPEQGIAALLA
jgi:hypothetical protein